MQQPDPSVNPTAGPARLLVIAAAPAEAGAVLAGLGSAAAIPEEWSLLGVGPVDLVRSGIGKSNAAGAVARFLTPARHRLVVSIGVAGALPRTEGPLPIGTIVVASASVYADEGLETEQGFRTCEAMGFPLGPFAGNAVPPEAGALSRAGEWADRTAPIATVSTCSGTDERARATAERTGAAAEAMEGAAVLHMARRLGVGGLEIRVISNTTGERSRQRWDLAGALTRMRALSARLPELLAQTIR